MVCLACAVWPPSQKSFSSSHISPASPPLSSSKLHAVLHVWNGSPHLPAKSHICCSFYDFRGWGWGQECAKHVKKKQHIQIPSNGGHLDLIKRLKWSMDGRVICRKLSLPNHSCPFAIFYQHPVCFNLRRLPIVMLNSLVCLPSPQKGRTYSQSSFPAGGRITSVWGLWEPQGQSKAWHSRGHAGLLNVSNKRHGDDSRSSS